MNRLSFLKSGIVVMLATVFAVSCDDNKEPEVDNVPVTGIQAEPANATIEVGGTVELTVTVLPAEASNKEYEFIVDNPDLVNIDDNVVTGLSAGVAHITVITEDGGKTASIKITVKEKTEAVAFELQALDITESDIVVRITAPEDVRYWIWCAEKNEVGDLSKEELLAYDRNLIEKFRIAASEEEGRDVAVNEVLAQLTYKGSQDRSMRALLDGVSDIKAATEYVIWIYGMDLEGNATTDIYAISAITEEDPSGSKPTYTNSNFTAVVEEVLSTSVMVSITPSNSGNPYFAYPLPAYEFEEGGWFYGCSDGQIVFELFGEFYYDSLMKYKFTGEQTVEMANLKVATEYVIVVFHGQGTLSGDMLKFNVTTAAE